VGRATCLCDHEYLRGIMKFFTRRLIRYVATGVVTSSVMFTLAVITTLQPESALDDCVSESCLDRPRSLLNVSAADSGTQQPRDWRRTNRVVLEYKEDVARRLKKLAEHQTPADHPDTISLARDLLDPPPDNRDGIKHARYIMKTPQAKKVEEITQKMVYFAPSFIFILLCLTSK